MQLANLTHYAIFYRSFFNCKQICFIKLYKIIKHKQSLVTKINKCCDFTFFQNIFKAKNTIKIYRTKTWFVMSS